MTNYKIHDDGIGDTCIVDTKTWEEIIFYLPDLDYSETDELVDLMNPDDLIDMVRDSWAKGNNG